MNTLSIEAGNPWEKGWARPLHNAKSSSDDSSQVFWIASFELHTTPTEGCIAWKATFVNFEVHQTDLSKG